MRIALPASSWLLFALGEEALLAPSPPRVVPDPDCALVQRATRGDRQAFSELYRRHVEPTYRRLTHLLGPDPEREDLVQQVFLEVFRSIPSFRGESRFATWLYRVIVNVAYEHLRRNRRRALCPLAADSLDLVVAAGTSPEAAARQRQQVALALTLLGRLKPDKRIAFVLRVVEGLSLEEIPGL